MSRRAHDDWTDPGGPRIRPFLAGAAPIGQPPAEADAHVEAPRPFVITSGRVPGQGQDFEIEAQVSTRDEVDLIGTRRLSREKGAIVALCAEPMSVAEISATLHLHLGVTKVLVGDLHAAGYVDVYTFDIANANDSELILRVMRGLRAIA
jgi:Protein of unknown function (DUF742)